MQIATIPFTRFDPGNELARAYMCEPERALPLFARDYREPRNLRPLLEEQGRRERPSLGDDLVAYNREVGGDVENAQRLGEAFCVVGGQQVGLLLGPAYTTYKLFTVINAARVLSQELGVAVVPVFWVESEDHDWAEVNRFFWKGRRYRLEGDVAPGTPVSRIELDPAQLVADLRAELGEEGDAWEIVAEERGVARWHVRNLARLVAGRGVVFVEPGLLREPMRPLAERISARGAEIDETLEPGGAFDPVLEPPRGAYLFDSSGARVRLERGAPLPEMWSTDVVSRVLVQNAALPVLAAACGPAEIAYWGQLKGAHALLDIPMPAVLPRDGATLVEAGIARDAARLGFDLEEAVRGVADAPKAPAEDPVALRLLRLSREAGELKQAMQEGSLELPPTAERPFKRTVERLEADLEKLARRIHDARAEMAGAGRRRHERVLRELRPRGGPQERSHSLLPYLLRHGLGLVDRLLDSFDPYEFGHYLVRL